MSESMFMAAALNPPKTPLQTQPHTRFSACPNLHRTHFQTKQQLPHILRHLLQSIRTTSPFNCLSETKLHHTVPALTSKTREKVHISLFDPSPIYLLINTNEWKSRFLLETYDNGEYLVLVTLIESLPQFPSRDMCLTRQACVGLREPNI
ncbi:hypothetical protein Ahy_B01g055926 [Arachis hypogaea]|uniref:Uncharacterized protein n=1 Tax=Arachis hypogaea TaxID=3818 RepID=A0A445AXG5_ARAHY|nr:hypothetical protein Ahy_B01g055926 [Arachis hypogaea]